MRLPRKSWWNLRVSSTVPTAWCASELDTKLRSEEQGVRKHGEEEVAVRSCARMPEFPGGPLGVYATLEQPLTTLVHPLATLSTLMQPWGYEMGIGAVLKVVVDPRKWSSRGDTATVTRQR